VIDSVSKLLDDPQLSWVSKVQSLWSDYGEIVRVFSPKHQQSFVVKAICPPSSAVHPRGWNTNASHQRKVRSYQIEATFYQKYAQSSDIYCRIPKLLGLIVPEGAEPYPEHDCDSIQYSEQGAQSILVLEDLDCLGFTQRYSQLDADSVLPVISWLAHFHAKHLGTNTHSLWPVGTYWHLDTRIDEYQAMADCALKSAAHLIDQKLRNAQHQTLVHGDAKVANFCFAEQSVAAVDFQYVGGGVGVKDLAYLLGSCLDQHTLFTQGEHLLDVYLHQLVNALDVYSVLPNRETIDSRSLVEEWRHLYPVAWADFHRFLLGWSPNHAKINAYMQCQTDMALQQL
jgi:hypothetical protein